MAKYIDADLLRKEIDDIEEEARKVRVSGTDKEAIGADGKVRLCLKLKAIIDSLQQEQQEVDLDKEMSRFIRTYLTKPEYDRDFIAEVDWENSMRECARYFYGLGQLNSK